jgi:hypothetical protein
MGIQLKKNAQIGNETRKNTKDGTLKKLVTVVVAMSKALPAEQATLQAKVSKLPCSYHGFYKPTKH